jgi:hypothetical protein
MSKRRHINKDTKIAACLLELFERRGYGIPFREAQGMTVAAILARVQWAHAVPHALGGSIHPTNLTPMPTAQHREETRKKDIPAIAKSKRIQRKRAAAPLTNAVERMIAIDVRGDKADRPKAVMPGSKASGWKRKMNGRVERRGC